MITVLMQKHLSPITVSFIYILEPVLGAIVANLYLHEMLPLLGYLGGCLVVVGTIIHTWSVSWHSSKGRSLQNVFTLVDEHIHRSIISLVGYPLLLLGISFILLYRYGGFPPAAWLELYHLWPDLSNLEQQGRGTAVILLFVQVGCWFIAWVTFGTMVLLTAQHIVSSLLFSPRTPPSQRALQQLPNPSNVPSYVHEQRKRENINAAMQSKSPTLSILDELVS
jgi:hypothetical protein